jgi:hypothetical protein
MNKEQHVFPGLIDLDLFLTRTEIIENETRLVLFEENYGVYPCFEFCTFQI